MSTKHLGCLVWLLVFVWPFLWLWRKIIGSDKGLFDK